MRIGISGATGLIGRSVVSTLKSLENVELTVLTRTEIPCADRQIIHVLGDLADPKVCDALVRDQDVIIHLAHESSPLAGGLDPVADVSRNLFPSLRLINSIEVHKRRPLVIYLSSGGTVYGSKTYQKPFTEEDPCFPTIPYGIQKLAIEHYLHSAANRGILRATILRVSNAYGYPLPPSRAQGLIGISVSRVKQNLPLRVVGNPHNIRDYIHISDVTNAVLLALNQQEQFNIFNIGSGVGTSVLEILKTINEIAGRVSPVEEEELPGSQWLPGWCVLDVTKAKRVLGWEAKMPLVNGIRKMFETDG